MVRKIDNSRNKQTIKLKQKQNVNVRVNIDQRDLKKKPRKKRSNLPSAKREGVSSFSTGFTPVYIQSGNPYPIAPIPPVPDAIPIRVPLYQREVPSLVNPPTTSTTNINNPISTPLTNRSTSTPLLSESGIHGRGLLHHNPSDNTPKVTKSLLNDEIKRRQENRSMGNEDNNANFRRLPNDIRNSIRGREERRQENRSMGNEDNNVNLRRLPNDIQNSIRESSNNMDIVEIPSNDIAVSRVKRKYTKKNEIFWLNKKYRRDGGL